MDPTRSGPRRLGSALPRNQLYDLRLDHRLTMEQLARRCDVSYAQIQRWETLISYPRRRNELRLAAAFGITHAEIVRALDAPSERI